MRDRRRRCAEPTGDNLHPVRQSRRGRDSSARCRIRGKIQRERRAGNEREPRPLERKRPRSRFESQLQRRLGCLKIARDIGGDNRARAEAVRRLCARERAGGNSSCAAVSEAYAAHGCSPAQSGGRDIFRIRGAYPGARGAPGKNLRRVKRLYSRKNAGLASHAGFKDWTTQALGIPSFTFELGKGENPLPPSDLESVYKSIEETLVLACVM